MCVCVCVCVCVCGCVCQNIPLRGNRENTKDHPEVGKVVLPIPEILLQNYYGIDSKEGTKTLKTSFRMPNGILLQFRFIWFFCSFFMIYSMVGKYKQLRSSSVQHLGKKKVIWKYRLFWSAVPARQYRITSFSPDDWIFSSCAFWVMDGVICGIYLALITVVAEIVIEKSVRQMW